MDLEGLLERFEGEEMKIDFHMGGRRLAVVTFKEKNIDMDILDVEGFKDFLKRVRG
ncbi:MAG: hypothetical protein GXO65_05850 [Euryarchaeota archaeon]|nr:hypothetical protein [Euryarchaeota archaeon]